MTFDPIGAVTYGFCTGLGIIAGQYAWQMYIQPHIIEKIEFKILKKEKLQEQNDNTKPGTNNTRKN